MTRPTNNATWLLITPLSGREGLVLRPYSTRNATQTLEQIDGGGKPRRSINGNMVDLTAPQFRKYQSVISCSDFMAPALDGAWEGMVVEVQCCIELAYVTGGTPQRNEVSGSSRTEDGFTIYRPQLIMMVMAIKNAFAEWETKYSWQASLVEV